MHENRLTNINGCLVPIYDLQYGGVDNAVRYGTPVFENRWLEIYPKLFKPGDVVYDIGAYIGTHSILFSLLGASQVHAFEPAPVNYKRMDLNIRQFRQIILHRVALHTRDYNETLRINDCNAALSGVEQHTAQNINFVDTAKYLRDLPKPDLVKVDIEGMESIVLNQMLDLIVNHRPTWQIEFHRGAKFENGLEFIDKENGGFDFDLFPQNDYRLFLLKNGELNEVASFYGQDGMDYICVPTEKDVKMF